MCGTGTGTETILSNVWTGTETVLMVFLEPEPEVLQKSKEPSPHALNPAMEFNLITGETRMETTAHYSNKKSPRGISE
jgi:hypothetical protein